jgi:hypothetical protein
MRYCCRNSHRVFDVTATATNLILSVSNSTNIGDNERFKFYFPKSQRGIIGANITSAPLPVLISVNGADVQLIDTNGQAVLSNRIPIRSDGRYIVPAIGDPYVLLYYPNCMR